MADTVGKANPFLYRGYYYNSKTGLYYLNSRYYDPQTGKFLNTDGQISSDLSDLNLFSYCNNSPVNMQDPDGNRAIADDGSYAITLRNGDIAVYDASTHQRSIIYYKEHSKNRSPSNRNKHEIGQKRKQIDRGGEKGDARRVLNPNKRRPSTIQFGVKQDVNWEAIGKNIAATGAAAGAGYLIYRGIRMIPSFFPVLWWTIPGNLATP